MTGHMETPWRYEAESTDEYAAIMVGNSILVMFVDSESAETASVIGPRIVRAVNSQEGLLEALRLCIEHFNKTDALYDRNGRRVDFGAVLGVVSAALKVAEEER